MGKAEIAKHYLTLVISFPSSMIENLNNSPTSLHIANRFNKHFTL